AAQRQLRPSRRLFHKPAPLIAADAINLAPALPERAYARVLRIESRRCARRGLALPPKVPRWIAVSPKTTIAPRLAAGSAARRICSAADRNSTCCDRLQGNPLYLRPIIAIRLNSSPPPPAT